MATESITDKLRKVLALTNSPVEGEALAAAAHLARLLSLHNLDIADLEQKGAVTAPGITEGDHDLGKAAFKWKLHLADVVAEHYYCVSLTDHATKRVRFAGRPDNVDSLKLLYRWIVDQIVRIAATARKEHATLTGERVDPLRWQVSFGEGAVDRLGSRLAERRRRESDQAGSALAIHHGAEISDYLEEQYGFRRDGQPTKREREWQAQFDERCRRQRERDAELAELLKTDPEAYYAIRPWERPLSAKEQARQDKKDRARREAQERKWERQEARRRNLTPEEERRQEQRYRARQAGFANGDKINLEPFIEGATGAAARRIG
jgi:hypothetical protein